MQPSGRVIYTGAKAICGFLGISPSTLRELRGQGLPVVRIPGTSVLMLIAEDAVDWVRSFAVKEIRCVPLHVSRSNSV